MNHSATRSKAPTRRRDPKATRAKILASAEKLLAANNGALEMAWVAKDAGISHGIAYHHFGSREGLLQAVAIAFYNQLDDEVLMAPMAEFDSWRQREQARSRAHIAFILEHPLGSIVTNQLSAIPTIACIEAERWKLIVAEGARNIADGQKRGELGTDVPPELGAAMVLGAVRGAINQAVSEPATINIDQLNAKVWAFLGSGLQLSA